MASKAINQNDLIDIIKANVEVVTDTLNIIKNSDISSVYKSKAEFKKDIKMVFLSLDYITKLIIQSSSTILSLSNINNISKGYKNLYESLVQIKDIIGIIASYNNVEKSEKNIYKISSIMDSLIGISKNIALMVLYTPFFAAFISSSPIIFSTLGLAIQMIGKLTEVAKYSVMRFMVVKLFSLTARTLVKGFNAVTSIIKEVTKNFEKIRINPMKMLQILWCVNILSDIINVIRSIRTFFLVRKIKIIRMVMIQITKMLNMIGKSKHIGRAITKILLYKIAVDALFSLMLMFTIMAPVSLLFVAISPIIIICMFILAQVFNIIGLVISKSITKKAVRGLKNLTIAIIGITAVTLALIVLSKLSWTVVVGIPGIILLLMGLIVIASLTKTVMFIISKFTNKRTIRRLTIFGSLMIMLTAIAGLMVVLTAVASLALISMPNLILFLIGLLVITASIWLLLKIVKHITTLKIFGGLLLLAGLIASILGIGYLLIVLGSVALIIHANFLTILLFIGELAIIALAIGVLGFAIATLGVYALTIIAGLLLLTIVIGLVFLMGKMLISIQNMKLDKKLLRDNINTILDSVLLIIDVLFNTEENENNPTDKGWISNVLTKFMKGAADIMMAIMAVGFLALSLVSISLLLLLADKLKTIQNIDLDSGIINSKITTIIGAAMAVIDAIFQKDDKKTPKSNKGFLKDLIGSVFPGLKTIMQSIMSVGFLAISLASVGLIAMIAKHLTTIQQLPSMDGIDEKVKTIVSTAKIVIDSVFTDKDSGIGKLLKQMANNKKADLMLKSLLGTVETTSKCGLALIEIGKLDQALIDNSSPVIESVIKNINKFSTLNIDPKSLHKKIDVIDDLNSIIKDIPDLSDKDIKNTDKLTDNYIKFINKINDVKIDNLSKATNMFKEMARLSESIDGNFEGLAESLNEKIAPLLEQLKDILSKIPDNIKTSSDNIGQSISNNAAGPAGWNASIIKQNANNYAEEDRDEIMKEMERRSMESKADNTRIVEVLNNILDVMTGNGAYSEGVKTY